MVVAGSVEQGVREFVCPSYDCRRSQRHCRSRLDPRSWRVISQARRPEFRSLRPAARRVSVIAGSSRITVCCVQLISRPRSRHCCTIGAPSTVSSRPIISPHTRSSSTIASSSTSGCEPLAKRLAELRGPVQQALLLRSFRSWRCRRGRRSGCRRTWPRACRAAGWRRSRPCVSSAAPAMPPHRLLASVMISGVTPACW